MDGVGRGGHGPRSGGTTHRDRPFMRKASPRRMIIADPWARCGVFGRTGRMKPVGAGRRRHGEGLRRPNADLSLPSFGKGTITISDDESLAAARENACVRRVCYAGSSSGTLLAARARALLPLRNGTEKRREPVLRSGAKYLARCSTRPSWRREGWQPPSSPRHGGGRRRRRGAGHRPSWWAATTNAPVFERHALGPMSHRCRWSIRGERGWPGRTRATCWRELYRIPRAPTRYSHGRRRRCAW